MQHRKKVRCVVCDDHAMLRLGLSSAIEAAGDLEVVGQAADGPAAIELINRQRPDVAVVDLHMPGASGLEVARACANMTKLLLFTADEDPGTAKEALAVGAAGILLKRGPLDELARAVQAVAVGHRYVDPTLAVAMLDHGEDDRQSPLTQREAEVLQLLADGLTTQATATQLFLSPATVRSYVENAMFKLGTNSRTAAVASAMRDGLIR